MAQLIIHKDEIQENIKKLNAFFKKHDVEWSLITKVFSGDIDFLNNVLTPEIIQDINSIGDSRLTSMKNLKKINPDMKTIYLKPPAEIYAEDIVKYADISLNTQYKTIAALNKAAIKQQKNHKVIIMIELGELREGVNRANLIEFYQKIFELSNIEVIGLGANLGCMYGVEPTYDKLLQLVLYKELINEKFNKKLKLVSGGSSITLPLIEQNFIPKGVNHFRIGEAAFFGTSPMDNEAFATLSTNTFEFHANIIELEKKAIVPDGVIQDANVGHTAEYDEGDIGETTYKAILDFGILDVDINDITAFDQGIEFVGTTSDMTVVDLVKNKNEDGTQKYRVGHTIAFKPNYMAVARLLNSKFIDKKFI
ncbi:MAG: amino-acid racemase [Bacteroidetes bacterium 4572_77]|nr:MAG: amino-acid racemase [Bacteroidetes bacterium 4572_77]